MKIISPQRILESIPGVLVWGTILVAIFLSYFKPIWAIYFIIAFDLYWLLRVLYLMIYMLSSWNKYRQCLKIDWLKQLTDTGKDWEGYIHAVFLPVYNEPYQVIRETFLRLSQSRYDLKKMIIILSGEERGGAESFWSKAERIKKEFGICFKDILLLLHPANLPDEIPGKGSNLNFAGKKFLAYAASQNINPKKIIVSSFDIDTCVHPYYFAHLTHSFITHPNPYRVSFQPIAVYTNNVWESNPIIRVVASSTTFWLLTDIARPERLFTFSSHSMSFQALTEVGFWDKTIVTEDSRIFLQCFVRYRGEYGVVPLYLPVYMNTVDVGGLWKSFMNQYKQMRRWAWGVEHFPWMVQKFTSDPDGRLILWRKKIRYVWNQLEGVYSWATAPILMFILGHFPLWFAPQIVRETTLFQNTPHALSYLMRISMLGIMVISILYYLMLPPRPAGHGFRSSLVLFAQWLLVPVTLIVFGAFPAIDAQTRLLLGGRFRLGFWVTEKHRVEKNTLRHKWRAKTLDIT